MRCFHTSLFSGSIKPAFKPNSSKVGVRTFEKNFEAGTGKKEIKIWDQRGISKHEFFIRKYGNISPEERRRLDEKVARQKFLRKERKKHEAIEGPSHPKREKILLNPLCEYLYGTHSVLSALEAGKREAFSTLYIHNVKEHTHRILGLAQKYGVRVVEKKTKGELNTLSSNGVHNGVVLETKPLILPEIESFSSKFDGNSGTYDVNLIDDKVGKKTKTEEVSRTNQPDASRFPLGIYVDGVTDPQNLGNIIRSAYYLGADFMVIPESESARLGPVTAKAAAGALDIFKIYKSRSAFKLIDSARANGWTILSTSSTESGGESNHMNPNHHKHESSKYITQSDLPRIMKVAPMLMVLGSEGEGVRTNIKLKSDFLVGWTKGRLGKCSVDSLNVAVAAGLVVAKVLE